MFTLKLVGAAAAASIVALVPIGAAQATYVDPTMDLSASKTTVVEGSTFTARATSNLTCDWTLSFSDTAKTGAGKAFSTEFTAPDVDKKTKLPLVGTCAYNDAAPSAAPATAADTTAVVPAATRELSRTITITVLPKGAKNDDSALPDTGGSDLTLLLIGGALVAAGGAVTVAARRRGAHA